MELDNIKAIWTSLDERLKKQENIKESVLKELIHSKGNKALDRLSNFEWFGLIICIVASPVIPYFLYTQYNTFNILSLILLCIFAAAIFLGIGSQLWKIRTLGEINYTNKIGNNVRAINKYNLFIKKEKGLSIVIFILLSLFYISRAYFDNANLNSTNIFLFFFLIFVGSIIAQWQYKTIYNKNIDSIQRSLSELKELEEE